MKTIGKSRHGMIAQLFFILPKPIPTNFENHNPNLLNILSKFESIYRTPWSTPIMIPLKP